MSQGHTNIRNFSIIAHIDHGKSTLADRILEITQTIEKRKMRDQVLDGMDIERERGITIKMTPVRIDYTLHSTEYTLNLIDTPGHIDFSYEVSRALRAVEGVIFLVDATQGVQAQTISVLEIAQKMELTIIPVVTKIDSPRAEIKKVKEEVAKLLNCSEEEISEVSGRTGEGVSELLKIIVEKIPPPAVSRSANTHKALVFDFHYSSHQGIVVFARVFDGSIEKGDKLLFSVTGEQFSVLEVGFFKPEFSPQQALKDGEIGYIVTGIKEIQKAIIGDTITSIRNPEPPLPGYKNPSPVVWASLYPESQDDFFELKDALLRLRLSDFSLSMEEELSPSLGRGFRCGFLGMLHLEIITERLKREFDLELVMTTPSVVYEVKYKNDLRKSIYSPVQFPDPGAYEQAYEPWVGLKIITPTSYLGNILQTLHKHEARVGESESFGESRMVLLSELPLREFMAGFFSELKNVSSGYASFSYEMIQPRLADVIRLDLLIAEERIPAFSRVVAKNKAYEEAKKTVDQLYDIVPRQLFPIKIQGSAGGKILSSKTLSALKKDVTGYLYGGDITRKRKLWEKQKKGKKKLKERGKVNIPTNVFLEMVKRGL